MKQVLILSFFIFIIINVRAQEKEITPFNEVMISANRTMLQNKKTKDNFGFGLALYRQIKGKGRFNAYYGLEFNQSKQLKSVVDKEDTYRFGYEGYFLNADVLILSFSITGGCRVFLDKKQSILFDLGPYLDLINGTKVHGLYTSLNYAPNSIGFNQTTQNTTDFVGSKPLSFGISGALGMIFPIKNMLISIKPEFKYGFSFIHRSTNDDIYNRYFRLCLSFRQKLKE